MGQVLAFSALVSWVVTGEVERLSQRDRVKAHGAIQLLRRHRDVEWIYTARTASAFHAGIKVIPELAVVPQKRRWAYGYDESGNAPISEAV